MRLIFGLLLLLATAVPGFGCGRAGGGAGAGQAAAVPGQDLFTQHGWAIAGAVTESRDKLPPDFQLRSGSFPWVIYLDLSRDIGLDFAPSAGQEVRVLRFPVKDSQGGRLEEIAAKYALEGVVLVDQNQAVGAWITYTAKDGTRPVGNPGYSLKGRDLEQVTGLTWPEYAAAYSPAAQGNPEPAVRARAKLAMRALQAADGKALAALAHPVKGVRFSPYAFVRTGQDGDVVLTPAQLRGLGSDQTVYRWGRQDGNDQPIDLTIAGYLKRFATRDYLGAGQVGYNRILRQGNTRVNIQEAYPNGIFVEYYVPGTGEHADFTWSSVRLVFEQDQGVWYLVGVINDQWTI